MTPYRIKSCLLTLLAACLITAPAWATEPWDGDNRSVDGFDTRDVITTAFEGMLSGDCLIYCVVGWRARLVISLTRSYVSVQPLIEHNLPDTLLQVYPHTDGTHPWKEWRALMSKPQTEFVTAGTNIWSPLTEVAWLGIGQVSGGLLGSGTNATNVAIPFLDTYASNGETHAQQHGATDTVITKEHDVLGNPMSYLPELINDDPDGFGELGTLGSQSFVIDSCGIRDELEGHCEDQIGTCGSPNCLEHQGGTRNNALLNQVNDAAPVCRTEVVGHEGGHDNGGPIYGEVCEPPEWQSLTLEELASAAWSEVGEFLYEYQQNFDYYKNDPRRLVELFYGQDISRIMNMKQAIDEIKKLTDFFKALKTYYDIMNSTIQGYTWGAGRLDVDRLMCESDIYPFFPYGTSTVDAIQWRAGFPITDLHKLTTIFNPLDTSGIGRNGWPGGGDYWGPVFPRDSQVSNSHDAKAGAVISARALSSVSGGPRGGVFGRLVINLPNGGHRYTGRPDREKVQMFYPQDRSCRTEFYDPEPYLVKDGAIHQARDQRYAYHVWRRYQCYTSERGSITLRRENWGSNREICIL